MFAQALRHFGHTGPISIDVERRMEKYREVISIKAFPCDARCDCCGRHVSELRPFGKAGDPLVGDFDGAFFVRRFRTYRPRDEEVKRIVCEYLDRARDELLYEGAEQLGPEMSDSDETLSAEDMFDVHARVVQVMSAEDLRAREEFVRLVGEETAEQLLGADYATEQAEPASFAFAEEVGPIIGYAVAERARELMARDLGTEETDRMTRLYCAADRTHPSWECRDCAVLGPEEYHEKRRSRMNPECKSLH